MKIKLYSKVPGRWEEVYEHFNKDLFLYLLPPGARLIRFDGSAKDDIVHIQFPMAAEWISHIVKTGQEQGHAWFVDTGVKLPFGLTDWEHKHHVYEEDQESSRIVDEMEFSTGNRLKDTIIYPFLLLAFLPRVWQYKKYFNRLFSKDHAVS